MKIRVLFFAQLKDMFGAGEKDFEISEGTDVKAFAQKLLSQEADKKALARLPFLYAVNEEFVSEEVLLRDGDRLALLPPVAGG